MSRNLADHLMDQYIPLEAYRFKSAAAATYLTGYFVGIPEPDSQRFPGSTLHSWRCTQVSKIVIPTEGSIGFTDLFDDGMIPNHICGFIGEFSSCASYDLSGGERSLQDEFDKATSWPTSFPAGSRTFGRVNFGGKG